MKKPKIAVEIKNGYVVCIYSTDPEIEAQVIYCDDAPEVITPEVLEEIKKIEGKLRKIREEMTAIF